MATGRPVINLPWDVEGVFLERINRFLCRVSIGGVADLSHVHDPGRLKELLVPGARVLLRMSESSRRKTKWDILAVEKGGSFVLVHSGYHRAIAEAVISDPSLSPFGAVERLEAEVSFGRSRVDFLVKAGGFDILVEVKGCTLERDGVALFPDAPTSRGRRHVKELTSFVMSGGRAAVIFLVFVPSARYFSPNLREDPRFSRALIDAVSCGVEVFPMLLSYGKDGVVRFFGHIPFVLPDT